MAHILARKQADGSIRYTAVVRIRNGQQILHREAKTFSLRAHAEKWAKHREVALEDPSSLLRQNNQPRTLRSLIRWYIDGFGKISGWQRSKQAQLEFLERHSMSKCNALALTAQQLIRHVQTRRAEGAGPATVSNDLTWIGVVLRAARGLQAILVRPEIAQEARAACRELRLIRKSRRRERRPTTQELGKLTEYFMRRDGRAKIPMLDIMQFAIESARRESEICRLEWSDNDDQSHTGIVRDAKHPRDKEGNHRRFKLTPEAWAIVEHQPRTSSYIFPYNPKSICAAFTRACHLLGIINLHFHDLRHEATSRFFERGYLIHEVPQFTLHESWNELKRYTNLRAENVRDIPAQPTNVIPFPERGDPTTTTPRAAAAGQSAPRGPQR
ncbi:MAG TPA: site-specific integrase [Steroidobacteraceae bacterium]|jgi:integrase